MTASDADSAIVESTPAEPDDDDKCRTCGADLEPDHREMHCPSCLRHMEPDPDEAFEMRREREMFGD